MCVQSLECVSVLSSLQSVADKGANIPKRKSTHSPLAVVSSAES